MSTELCKLRKQLKKDYESYVRLVRRPRFICPECGRTARKKKYLCQSRKLET